MTKPLIFSNRLTAVSAAFALLFLPSRPAAAAEGAALAAPSLAGTWRLLPKLSTDLTPWQALDIVIAVDGPRVSIQDKFAAGTRTIDTLALLDLSRDVSVVPIPWWTDNRHIGAYIGGDRTERVHARWLEGGRIFRTDADLVLDTQQGPHPVNVLTYYTLSASGDQLTVFQLRSTREIPIVYILKRISP